MWITEICIRRTTVQVAGELIEQQDQRQRTVRRRLPIHQFAVTRLWYEILKTLPNLVIDLLTTLVPEVPPAASRLKPLKARPQPKIDNLRDGF